MGRSVFVTQPGGEAMDCSIYLADGSIGRLSMAGLSVTGTYHIGGGEANQDGFTICRGPVLRRKPTSFAFGMVTDGLGDLPRGDLASLLVKEAVEEQAALLRKEPPQSLEGARRWLDLDALPAARRALAAETAQHPELTMMAAAAAGALFLPCGVLAWNLGDVRVYRYSLQHGLNRMTRDHNAAEDCTEEQQRLVLESGRQLADTLTRFVNSGWRRCEPQFYEESLQRGDRWLFLSDGAYAVLEFNVLSHIIMRSRRSRTIAKFIVQSAQGAGSRDDITALVAVVS
jgi:PPM family protein phosphatase